MPLTFEQVQSLFESSRAKDPSRFGNMSLNDFVDYGNRGTGSNMFEAGRQNMLEEFNAGLQHDIGAALNYLGLPQAGRDVGSSVGAFLDKLLPASTQPNFYREQLGSIGQEIPQGVLENIPLFRGAKGVQILKNTLLSAGLGASHTYSKTQDLGDAAYTAGITALTPVLGALGRKAGLSSAEALSRRLGNKALADALKAGEGLTAKTAAKVGGITGIATGLTGIDVGKNYMTDNPAGLLGGLTPTQYGVTQLASLLSYELFGSLMEPKAEEKVRPSTMFEEVLARADEKKRVLASQAKLMEPMEGEFGSELITYEGPPTPDLPVTKAWAGKLDQFVGPQPFVQPYVAFESKAHTIWGVGGEEAVPEGRVEPTAPVVEAPLTHPVAQATARTSYDTAVSKGASIPKPWADQFGVPEGYEQKGLLFVKKETVPASTEPPVVVDKPAEVAKINTDIDALSSTPPPADPATLLQSVEGTVATAGKHGVPLPNDVQRGKTVESKTSKGDKLDEALPQQAQSDQNNVVLQLRIKRETLPDTVREETVNVVKAHADVMETEMAAVAADETLTPKAKADRVLALQREHDLYRAALMRHDGDFNKQIKVSEAYAKWKNDPNRDVGKLSKKMSDAVADVKRKEKNKEKTKTEGKKVVAKEQKSEAMADVYAEMVREAQTDKTTADIIKIFHHAATVIKPGDGAVSEVEMLAVGLTKWWKATEVEKRTVPEAKKVLARILKNAGQTRTEQGAEVFLRKDGTFGPATKENGHNLFPSYEDAMTFMQDLPSKEHLNHLYTVKRDPDGKGFRLSKRAKTKNESITPIDDEYEQSYVLDREQFTGDVTNGDLSDEFLDAHFMYIGHIGIGELRAKMSPIDGEELDRKIVLADQMSRAAGLTRQPLTEAQKAINNQIRLRTGFFRDPFTGQWMYEVSDRDFTVNGEVAISPQARGEGVRAGDLFRHNTLFNAYPELKDMKVRFVDPSPGAKYRGLYDAATNTITIVATDRDLTRKAFWSQTGLSLAVHEIQHAVQDREGFASGTTLEAADDARALALGLLGANTFAEQGNTSYAAYLRGLTPEKRRDVLLRASQMLVLSNYEIYHRAVGEIFARDAEMRRQLDEYGRQIHEPTKFGGKGIKTEEGFAFVGSVSDMLYRLNEGDRNVGVAGSEQRRKNIVANQDPTSTPFGRAVLFMTRFLTRDGRDERFAARTALDLGRVASILGDSLARWTELRGQRADDPRIGMEAKTAAGRIIALRALGSEHSDALASGVAFHELGEVFLREFEAGTLPQDLSAPMQKFMKDVVKAPMSERRALLTMLHDEMLPKSLRGDDLKAALLHPRNLKRPNEVMANVVAMITHASAHESNTTMGEHLMNLPWNMMQGVRAVFRYIRDGFRTLKSAMGYETLGNKLGLRLNNDNLFSLTKQLNSLVQNVSRHDMVMEQVSRASGLYSGGLARLMDEALVNPVWIQNIDGATKPVANFMSLGSVEKAVHDKVRKALPPLHTLDERPELRPLFNVIQQESMTIHAHMRRANALMYAVDPNQPLGPHNMDIKNGPLPRVTKDSTAADVLHKVLREAQVKGDAVAKTGQQGPTVFDLVSNNDPEVTGLLGRLNPAQRADVLEVIARSQEVNKLMAEDMYASNLRAGAKTMGVGLITKGLVPKDAAVAEDTASRIIEAAGDPNPLPLQQAVAALTPDPLLQQAVIDLALDRSQMAKKMYDQMLMRPYYITEQRLKQFHVTYKQNNGNKTGLADFNTEKEALDFIKDVRANPAYTLVDTAPRNSRKGFSKSQDIEPLLEQLANEQNKTKARLEQSLLTLGLTQDQVDNQLKMISFTTAVEEGHKLAVSGTIQLARKFAPGREFLDMIEQQSRMVNIYARKIATRDTDLSVALMKHDDKIYNDATKVSTDHAEQTIENGRIPDNQAQRIVNTMGYLWFVSSQISNTIMEQSSQLFQLAPKLVEEGAGISQSYKLVTQANGMLMQYGLNGTLPPEYQKLMNRLDLTGRGGQGSWAEADPVIQNESLAGNPRQAKGWMSVGTRLAQLSTKPYQMAVRYNEMVAAFASFKMLRERLYPNTTTLSPKEFDHLFAETVRISGLTQASFGKVNRPTMLFSTKDPLWRTSASMLYSLQGFAAGLYANVLRQARKGFGQELKSIVSPAERTDAKKAFTMTMATLVSAAGLAGIPMLMPLLKLIEPLTEKDFNSEITAFINRFMTEQFDAPTGDFVSQLSQHGLAHAMGMPVDISQRIAPGGLFGFNSYNGFDKERLVGGASLAIASNLFASVQAAEQGNWSQAFEKGLPPIIGHMASMAASGGNITASKGGVAIANPSNWQKIGYTLGLKPRELINYQDNSAAIKRADFIAKQQSERLVKKAADEVARGNPDGAIKLLGEEYQRSGTTFDPNAGFERVLKELEKRQFGTDVRDEVTLAGSNVWDRLAGRVVPEGRGSQVERLMFRDSIKQGVTGRGYAPRQYNSAMIEDLLRNNNPSMSSARAGAVSGWIQGQGQESEWARNPFELLAGVR